MDKVLIIGASYENLNTVIRRVFEVFAPDLENKSVLVKPNMLSPRKPEEHVTTNPALVRAVCCELMDRKVKFIVGDNPSAESGILNEEVGRRTGILDASFGHFRNISKSGKAIKKFSKLIDEMIVSPEILNYDFLISLPKFKTHALTTITGAIKNMYGVVPGAMKSQIHFRCAPPQDFAQILIDLYKIRPPDLTIMDAVVGMEGLGPGSGRLRSVGKVIASNNGAALDIIMAKMMGVEPKKILHLKLAMEEGLVEPDRIEIIGDLVPIKKFRLPPTFPSRGLFKFLYDKIVHGYRMGHFPCINIAACQRCKSCINICAAEAIIDGRLYPVIDEKKCILCYCCIEICPHKAFRTRLRIFRRR